ncbi:hypothetical protein ACRC7T_18075 [Segnochrobactraceae bacterium EtOH-i3]
MLKINAFSGEVPKTHPRLLGDGYAQKAHNTRMENGALVPIRQPRTERSVSADTRTFYLHNDAWLMWDHIRHAVPGPVATKRLYTTGGDYPQMLGEDDVWYKLALYPPSSRLTAALHSDSERLVVDGKEFLLRDGRSGDTPRGWHYEVESTDDKGTLTVTLTMKDGATTAVVRSTIDSVKYRNATNPVTEGIRTVSVTSLTSNDNETEYTCLDSFVDVGPSGETTTHCTPGTGTKANTLLTVNDGSGASARVFFRSSYRESCYISSLMVGGSGGVDLIDGPISWPAGVTDKEYADIVTAAVNAKTATTGFTAETLRMTRQANGGLQWTTTIKAPSTSYIGSEFAIVGRYSYVQSVRDENGVLVSEITRSKELYYGSELIGCSQNFFGNSSSGDVTSITIDGEELLTSTVSYSTPAGVASDIAAQVNAGTSTTGYYAEIPDEDDASVIIYSEDDFAAAVGRPVVVTGGAQIDYDEELGSNGYSSITLDWLDPDYATGDPAVAVFDNAVVSIPKRATEMVLTVSGLNIAEVDKDLSSTVLYSYTWVTKFDEESEPATLSRDLLWSPGNSIKLTGFATPQADRGIDRVRIYRSQTSALGETNLYFVAEHELADLGTSWIDSPDDNEIQEVCPSIDYNPPPDGLRGLIALPNGMMAAFKGRDLYFSEPWIPHAWPEKYMLSTNVDIVGLGAFGSSVAVLTEGTPYVVQGTSPDAMTMERLEVDLPCTSYRAIVDMGYLVAYPSHDGLVTVSSAGAQLISQTMFTREQWQEFNPNSVIATRHAGRYVMSYYTGSSTTGRDFMLMDLSGQPPFVLRGSADSRSFFYDPLTGRMFYLTPSPSDETIYWMMEFDCLDNPRLSQTWKSKQFVLPAHTNFGTLLIEAEPVGSETATVKVYADGVLKATVTKLNEPARLPSGFLARQWEMEVTGTAPVTGLTLAMSPAEIAGAT